MTSVYDNGILQMDFPRHRVTLRGRSIDLSPTEWRLLTALSNNAGIVLSIERLLELVWDETEVTHDNVRVYISYLRDKLGEESAQLIETVREFGYRYNPPKNLGV